METKLNIAEILKDKPKGIKLYCPLFGDVYLLGVDNNIIRIKCHEEIVIFFGDGRYYNYPESEQLLFPSKDMQDWSKFAWNKGDVLKNIAYEERVIFYGFLNDDYTYFKGKHPLDCSNKFNISYHEECNCFTSNYRLESTDAAQTYIKTIEKRLGGKLNYETLEIENAQPEFKDGDIVALVIQKCTHIAIFQSRQEAYIKFHAVLCQNDELLLEEPFREDVGDIELRLATEEEKKQLFSALEKEGKAWDAEKKQIIDLKPKVGVTIMIDDKKIDDAAINYINKNGYSFKYYEEPCVDIEFAYKEGYKDAINDFLKDLWHPSNEEPKEGFDLVYINKAKEFREISSYNSDRFNDLFDNGWEAACRRFGIYKWAYKDDLISKI